MPLTAAPDSPPGLWYCRPEARAWTCPPAPAEVLAFHALLPGYAPTPLHEMPSLATELGVGRVLVKDESSRLGLPAFKALGVSWAVARIVAERAGLRGPLTLPALAAAAAARPMTLVTATDGNHGRAVARTAAQLGIGAWIFVPEAVAAGARAAIAAEGARVTVVAGSYDDAVDRAARVAAELPDGELVQDTAWPGYELTPARIVEGYSTLLCEINPSPAPDHAETLSAEPDLVVTPVGVGSLAQAVVTHYRSRGARTAVLGVEPASAACVLAALTSGRVRSVATGDTVMAGLNCGTPSSLAWPVLRDGLDALVTVPDSAAAEAVTRLGELGQAAGPSGASSLAGAWAALADPARRRQLGVHAGSVVVLLVTEGPVPGDEDRP